LCRAGILERYHKTQNIFRRDLARRDECGVIGISKKCHSCKITFTVLLYYPDYAINRQDADDIRKKILSIPYVEWKKRGFSKGTLHHLKKQTDGDLQFYLQKQVMTRLDQWDLDADQVG